MPRRLAPALLALPVALLLGSGCSVAAAAAGASADTVRSLAEVDAAVGGAIAEGLFGGGGAVEVGTDPGPSPTERTFLCWLSQDGGEEIWADDAPTARRACVAYHGARGSDPRHCECEPLLAVQARRAAR